MALENRFVGTRGLSMPRSVFNLSNAVTFTCNVGDLVPVETWEVVPGDTFRISQSSICRLQTLLSPLMDDIHYDTYTFFVPNRLVWDHFQAFMGENLESEYYPKTEYFVPQITGACKAKSFLDYIGVPPDKNTSVSALYSRAYALIWNEWFRDENLQKPLLIDKGDNNHAYDDDNPVYGGQLLRANKYHDYFTSCLPAPQAGEPTTVPLINNFDGKQSFPVYARDQSIPIGNETTMKFRYDKTGDRKFDSQALFQLGLWNNNSDQKTTAQLTTFGSNMTGQSGKYVVYPDNLWADLSTSNVTINSLRLAFTVQQFLERNNLGGSRYTEIVRNHFGVISPDARLQRTELIGYSHGTLNISQVIQQSATSDTSPLGDVAAMSATYFDDGVVNKSFTEHGIIMTLVTFRYKHSYQQGINKALLRKNKFDFFFPVFNGLGEQAVLNKEIYVKGDATDDEVFGYQERYADYKYKPNRVAAEIRSTYEQPLDYWTLADKFDDTPKLDGTWIREHKGPVDRAIAVQSKVADQLICNFYFDSAVTRSMPVYNIPGLTRM